LFGLEGDNTNYRLAGDSRARQTPNPNGLGKKDEEMKAEHQDVQGGIRLAIHVHQVGNMPLPVTMDYFLAGNN